MVNKNIDEYITDKYIRDMIRKIRKSKGLTQRQLSEISGLGVTTISCMENGANNYTLDSLIRYTEALGYQINITKKVTDNDSKGDDKTVSSSSP